MSSSSSVPCNGRTSSVCDIVAKCAPVGENLNDAICYQGWRVTAALSSADALFISSLRPCWWLTRAAGCRMFVNYDPSLYVTCKMENNRRGVLLVRRGRDFTVAHVLLRFMGIALMYETMFLFNYTSLSVRAARALSLSTEHNLCTLRGGGTRRSGGGRVGFRPDDCGMRIRHTHLKDTNHSQHCMLS